MRTRGRESASRQGPAPSPAPGPPLPLAPGHARTRPRCPARPERRLRESGRRRPSAAPRAAAGLGGAARPPRPGRLGHRGAGRPEQRRGPARARARARDPGREAPPSARPPSRAARKPRAGGRAAELGSAQSWAPGPMPVRPPGPAPWPPGAWPSACSRRPPAPCACSTSPSP